MMNEFMKAVYHSNEYKPFEFVLTYSNIIKKWNEMPIICNGYSITTKAYQYNNFYNKFLLSTHESPILIKHHLCVSKWKDSTFTSSSVIDLFRQDLLNAMLFWIKSYVSMISDHFKSRSSEGRALHNHNSIKIQFGMLISTVSHAEEMVAIPLLYKVNCDLVKELGWSLHKIAGGRAFLQGNISEMLCLFEIIKKVYFSEEIL